MPKPTIPRLVIVDGYCRVSTDPQEDNTSLDEQEACIRAYCEEHGMPLLVVDVNLAAMGVQSSDLAHRLRPGPGPHQVGGRARRNSYRPRQAIFVSYENCPCSSGASDEPNSAGSSSPKPAMPALFSMGK